MSKPFSPTEQAYLERRRAELAAAHRMQQATNQRPAAPSPPQASFDPALLDLDTIPMPPPKASTAVSPSLARPQRTARGLRERHQAAVAAGQAQRQVEAKQQRHQQDRLRQQEEARRSQEEAAEIGEHDQPIKDPCPLLLAHLKATGHKPKGERVNLNYLLYWLLNHTPEIALGPTATLLLLHVLVSPATRGRYTARGTFVADKGVTVGAMRRPIRVLVSPWQMPDGAWQPPLMRRTIRGWGPKHLVFWHCLPTGWATFIRELDAHKACTRPPDGAAETSDSFSTVSTGLQKPALIISRACRIKQRRTAKM